MEEAAVEEATGGRRKQEREERRRNRRGGSSEGESNGAALGPRQFFLQIKSGIYEKEGRLLEQRGGSTCGSGYPSTQAWAATA